MSQLSSHLFKTIRDLIEKSKESVVRNINTTMLLTYFEIGKTIVTDEQNGKNRAEYAKETIRNLSRQLSKEFGRGYSVDNLQWMRKFYLTFQGRVFEKYETLSRISSTDPNYETLSRISLFSLSWSHYIQLMKIDNEDERNFY